MGVRGRLDVAAGESACIYLSRALLLDKERASVTPSKNAVYSSDALSTREKLNINEA